MSRIQASQLSQSLIDTFNRVGESPNCPKKLDHESGDITQVCKTTGLSPDELSLSPGEGPPVEELTPESLAALLNKCSPLERQSLQRKLEIYQEAQKLHEETPFYIRPFVGGRRRDGVDRAWWDLQSSLTELVQRESKPWRRLGPAEISYGF